MERIEYHNVVDKSSWPQGPWQSEPDKVQWPDGATGLPCLIVRGPSGALCGYVGVTKDHPLFHKEYDNVDLSAHGGLTFSDVCQPAAETHGICHVPGPGEPDHVWWFGFDCAHSDDYMPSWDSWTIGIYRDLAYVTRECQDLARQLAS